MFMERAKLYRNYSRVSVSGYQIKHDLKWSRGMRDGDTHVWRHTYYYNWDTDILLYW